MKGQTQTIFVFILAAIVIGIIVLIGFRGVQQIVSSGDETAKAAFLTEIRNDVASYQRLRGSSKVFEYRLPSEVDEICFFSGEIPPSGKEVLINYEEENLFLFDGDDIVQAENIGPVNAATCMNITGKLKIRITGQGNGVTIARV